MSGNSGIRMLESQAINDTYLALVKVFHALKRRQGLSAFCRDAKLTRLLRGALECKSSPCLVMITVLLLLVSHQCLSLTSWKNSSPERNFELLNFLFYQYFSFRSKIKNRSGCPMRMRKRDNTLTYHTQASPSRFRFQATLNTFSYLQLNGIPLDQCEPLPQGATSAEAAQKRRIQAKKFLELPPTGL